MYSVYYVNVYSVYPSEDNNYIWIIGNSIIKSIIFLTRDANVLIFRKCMLLYKIPQDFQKSKIWRKNGQRMLLKVCTYFYLA